MFFRIVRSQGLWAVVDPPFHLREQLWSSVASSFPRGEKERARLFQHMAILYAVVARGTTVLSEFSAVTGNIGAVARRILEKLPSEDDSRLCFSQDRYIFHIYRADGLSFLCMANDTFGSIFPLSYLLPVFSLLSFDYISGFRVLLYYCLFILLTVEQ